MGKPILIVRLGKKLNTFRDDFYKTISRKIDDYHVLILESETNETTFECFNGGGLAELDIKKLKEEINGKLNK